MESVKDEVSEAGEAEDLSSDFFDDFTKDEFMEGLSVVDECWGEVNGSTSEISQIRESRLRIDETALNGVKDLRELIGDNYDDDDTRRKPKSSREDTKARFSPGNSNLDNFIKPGSRRDPSKTNQAIRKDKEVKVQQFLAKTLESADDLRPPGTELDDYYEEVKKGDTNISANKERKKHSKDPSPSPQRLRRSPRRSPRRRPSPRARRSSRGRFSPRGRLSPRARYSPRTRLSPHARRITPRMQHSPPRLTSRKFTPSSLLHYVRHISPHRRSPIRRSVHRHSPDRRSPRRHLHRSRSPQRRGPSRKSRSRSRHRSMRHDDSFLYPNNGERLSGCSLGNPIYQPELGQQYAPHMHPEFSGGAPVNSGFYPQAPAYGDGFSDPYNYGMPQGPQISIPGPVIMPNVNQVPAQPVLMPNVTSVPTAPAMVPAPAASADITTPYDALAQLVAEGKISQEDYLKLTPHKGVVTTVDTKTRVMVLSRCNQALSKLKEKLLLPNRLMIHNRMIGPDEKHLAPKYCSPLKRQVAAEFNFTKGSTSPAQQTKQLVESIVSTLGLDKVVSKYKKKLPKDMKDAVVQTTKPQCDICEIRESTKYHDVGTSTEPEYFTSTVHTQVVEQDLFSSKSIFNPSGSVGEGAAISIAHLTPAQLVSQLAARAKTLKQPQESPPPNQYPRRPPPNYDYDNRGGQYHHTYNNYRY